MKSFYKFTVKSPAASYIPLPRFLLQDEQLRGISNDAKVLYALLLDRASVSRQKTDMLSRMGRFVCTLRWNRRRRSCTAADSVLPGFSASWNTAA